LKEELKLEGTNTVSDTSDQQKEPVNISCKEEINTNTTVSSTPGKKCTEAPEVTSATHIQNNGKGTPTQPQHAKRQIKNPAQRGQESVRPTLNIVNTNRDDKFVITVDALDLGNDVDQIGKFDDWDLGLMHHNMQSLNNKLLDIAMMLTG
jgi:hypothetical protein